MEHFLAVAENVADDVASFCLVSSVIFVVVELVRGRDRRRAGLVATRRAPLAIEPLDDAPAPRAPDRCGFVPANFPEAA